VAPSHIIWLAVTSARTPLDHTIIEAFLVITTRSSQNNMDRVQDSTCSIATLQSDSAVSQYDNSITHFTHASEYLAEPSQRDVIP
jgi:hypothetical protein